MSQTINPLDRVFQDGVLVILSIGKKSWKIALDPEIIKAEKVPENAELGRLLLLPEEALKKIAQIEGSARRYLDSQSLVFGSTARANFRFVPESCMLDTLVTLNDIRAQFMAAVEELILLLPEYRTKMKEKFPAQWPLVEKHHDITAASIRNEYYFTVESSRMAAPSQTQNVELEDLLRRQRLDKEVSAEYRAKAEAVLKEQQQQAQQRATEFVETTVRAFRSEVTKVFSGLAAKIRDNKPIIKTNVDTIRRTISQVRTLDFLDDRELQNRLAEVEALVDKSGDLKDNNQAAQELAKLLNSTVEFVGATTESVVAAKTKSYFGRSLAV